MVVRRATNLYQKQPTQGGKAWDLKPVPDNKSGQIDPTEGLENLHDVNHSDEVQEDDEKKVKRAQGSVKRTLLNVSKKTSKWIALGFMGLALGAKLVLGLGRTFTTILALPGIPFAFAYFMIPGQDHSRFSPDDKIRRLQEYIGICPEDQEGDADIAKHPSQIITNAKPLFSLCTQIEKQVKNKPESFSKDKLEEIRRYVHRLSFTTSSMLENIGKSLKPKDKDLLAALNTASNTTLDIIDKNLGNATNDNDDLPDNLKNLHQAWPTVDDENDSNYKQVG